jgi:hypothetical protein
MEQFKGHEKHVLQKDDRKINSRDRLGVVLHVKKDLQKRVSISAARVGKKELQPLAGE